jgi:hypothetical protein
MNTFRRAILAVTLLCLLAIPIAAQRGRVQGPRYPPVPAQQGPLVWVTEWGKKFHKVKLPPCQYLWHHPLNTKVPVSQAIAAGYTPCSKCGPP